MLGQVWSCWSVFQTVVLVQRLLIFTTCGHVDDVAYLGRCRIDWNEDTPMFLGKIHQYTDKKLRHLYVRKSNLKGKIRPLPTVWHGVGIGMAIEMRIHQRFLYRPYQPTNEKLLYPIGLSVLIYALLCMFA